MKKAKKKEKKPVPKTKVEKILEAVLKTQEDTNVILKGMIQKESLGVGVPNSYSPAGATTASPVSTTPPQAAANQMMPAWPAPDRWAQEGMEAAKKAYNHYLLYTNEYAKENLDPTKKLEHAGNMNLTIRSILQGTQVATEAAEHIQARVRQGDQTAAIEIQTVTDLIKKMLKTVWVHNELAKSGKNAGVELSFLEPQLTGRVNRATNLGTGDNGIQLDIGEEPHNIFASQAPSVTDAAGQPPSDPNAGGVGSSEDGAVPITPESVAEGEESVEEGEEGLPGEASEEESELPDEFEVEDEESPEEEEEPPMEEGDQESELPDEFEVEDEESPEEEEIEDEVQEEMSEESPKESEGEEETTAEETPEEEQIEEEIDEEEGEKTEEAEETPEEEDIEEEVVEEQTGEDEDEDEDGIKYCLECDREVTQEDIDECQNENCPFKQASEEKGLKTEERHYVWMTEKDHSECNTKKFTPQDQDGIEGTYCSDCKTVINYSFNQKSWDSEQARKWVVKTVKTKELENKTSKQIVTDTLEEIDFAVLKEWAESTKKSYKEEDTVDVELPEEGEISGMIANSLKDAFDPLDKRLSELAGIG